MGNWAELPADILALIAKQLTLFEDFLFFGGVCKSWHSVAIKDNFKGSEQVPWLMLSNNDKPDEQLFISQSKGSVACRVNLPEVRGKQRLETLGWLVTIANGDIDLLHPFTRVQIPSPRLIICHDHVLKSMNESIHKAVLSSSPGQSEDFDLVVIYGDFGYPAFWRHGDEFWIDVQGVPSFEDIISCEGIFYGVTNRGTVHAFDIVDHDNWTVKMVLDRPDTFFNYELHKQIYLVESEGVILLVSQDPGRPDSRDDDHGTCRFQVFEATLAEEKGEWVEITSLGDKALFLGDNASVAVDATRFPGIKANCIYYADKYWEFCKGGRRHTGVYCLEDGSRSHCYEEQSFNSICPPLWVNSPSF